MKRVKPSKTRISNIIKWTEKNMVASGQANVNVKRCEWRKVEAESLTVRIRPNDGNELCNR